MISCPHCRLITTIPFEEMAIKRTNWFILEQRTEPAVNREDADGLAAGSAAGDNDGNNASYEGVLGSSSSPVDGAVASTSGSYVDGNTHRVVTSRYSGNTILVPYSPEKLEETEKKKKKKSKKRSKKSKKKHHKRGNYPSHSISTINSTLYYIPF